MSLERVIADQQNEIDRLKDELKKRDVQHERDISHFTDCYQTIDKLSVYLDKLTTGRQYDEIRIEARLYLLNDCGYCPDCCTTFCCEDCKQ